MFGGPETHRRSHGPSARLRSSTLSRRRLLLSGAHLTPSPTPRASFCPPSLDRSSGAGETSPYGSNLSGIVVLSSRQGKSRILGLCRAMIRLIIILVLILLIIWVGRSILEDLKSLSTRGPRQRGPKKKSPSRPDLPVADKLVEDPVCGVYCPKSTAYTAIWKGKVYYFCSEECRQKFLKEHSSASSG